MRVFFWVFFFNRFKYLFTSSGEYFSVSIIYNKFGYFFYKLYYINMIVESIIKGLKNEPITLKDETVESTNPYLPKLFNCGMWIGSKGTGKTWSLVRLLRHYEDSPIVDKKR